MGITEIIQFRRGYMIRTDIGYEPMSQGWEMRSLKEFQKLSRTQVKRFTFVMVFKLAFQMNLQITLFIIAHIHKAIGSRRWQQMGSTAKRSGGSSPSYPWSPPSAQSCMMCIPFLPYSIKCVQPSERRWRRLVMTTTMRMTTT